VKPAEATIFLLLPTPKLCESMFLGASSVEPFRFTPFGRKPLQTAHEAAGEALLNGALVGNHETNLLSLVSP
jgi:hypothetical protein